MAQKFVFNPVKATQQNLKARMIFHGVSGGGKTWSALEAATELRRLDNDPRPINFLDTENSARKYAKYFDFDIVGIGPNSDSGIETHHPSVFTEWIKEMGPKSSVLVIDSLSHEWDGGVDSCTVLAERVAQAKYRGNTWSAWGDVKPLHNEVIQAIIACPCHVIVTLRGKTEWVIEQGQNGKKTPVKTGMGYISEKTIEFEFDISCVTSGGGNIAIDKTRMPVLQGEVFSRDVPKLIRLVHSELNSGTVAPKYAYGDGSEVLDNPATKRVFAEFVTEYSRNPENREELGAFIKERNAREKANAAASRTTDASPGELDGLDVADDQSE